MTNRELIEKLVVTLREQGKDPMFIVGYLESFLIQVVEGSPKKYQSQVHSDLLWHLRSREENA